MDHAELNASSGERWLACPGSVEANRGKERKDNVYSLNGTSAHALLEVCLLLGEQPERFYGKVLQAGHDVIDQDMVDGVAYALDYAYAYLADNPKAILQIEQRVHYGKSIGTDDKKAFGHPDIQIDNYPVELVTIDYKHGVGIPVGVKNNVQLRLYHAGKRQERGRYRRYRSVVVQPRIRGRKPIAEHTYTDAELSGWLNKTVIPVVPVALGKNAPRVAGKHCRYCKANGNCSAQYEEVLRAAKKEFAVKDPKALTPAQIAAILDTFSTLDAIYKVVKERAVTAVHAGVSIPGYEKSWGNQQRKWKDEEEANAHLEALGLEKRDRYSVALISPASAEDVLRKKALWPKKQRGVKQEFTPLDEVVQYTDAAPSIRKAAQ